MAWSAPDKENVMPKPIAERIAVSTWSLHRVMGTSYPHDLSTAVIGPAQEPSGPVGESLLADYGNWRRPSNYDELEKIIGRAELTHAKATFNDGALDAEDYGRIVDMAEAAGYSGPYTLIFDNDAPGEWAGLAVERDFIINRVGCWLGDVSAMRRRTSLCRRPGT